MKFVLLTLLSLSAFAQDNNCHINLHIYWESKAVSRVPASLKTTNKSKCKKEANIIAKKWLEDKNDLTSIDVEISYLTKDVITLVND